MDHDIWHALFRPEMAALEARVMFPPRAGLTDGNRPRPDRQPSLSI